MTVLHFDFDFHVEFHYPNGRKSKYSFCPEEIYIYILLTKFLSLPKRKKKVPVPKADRVVCI